MALRLLIDQYGFTTIDEHQVITRLRAAGADSATSLANWLEQSEPGLIGELAEYTHIRKDLGDMVLHDLLRTEDEAKDDFATVSSDVIKRYGTRTGSHHQSSKVMVQTVEVITRAESVGQPDVPDTDPQKRAALINSSNIWVSPRRLDGALPSLSNPVGLWEIKEYWGLTSGGSKMSDAVYELQLVGTELQLQEALSEHHVEHVAIVDGKHQWSKRKSDLRRIIDLLYCGLLDEVIWGREVLTDWGPAVRRMWQRVTP